MRFFNDDDGLNMRQLQEFYLVEIVQDYRARTLIRKKYLVQDFHQFRKQFLRRAYVIGLRLVDSVDYTIFSKIGVNRDKSEIEFKAAHCSDHPL